MRLCLLVLKLFSSICLVLLENSTLKEPAQELTTEQSNDNQTNDERDSLRWKLGNETLKGSNKIINGFRVEIEDYPYLGFMFRDVKRGYYLCGCSLVSHQHALTAGHCLKGAKPKDIVIRFGSKYNNKGGILVDISALYIHPTMDKKRPPKPDIGILKLSISLTMPTMSFHAVQMATSQDTGRLMEMMKEKTTCRILGWGSSVPTYKKLIKGNKKKKYKHEEHKNYLQAVDTKLLTWDECRNTGFKKYINEDYEICTNMPVVSGPCYGDSGGPLLCEGKIYGIVSWGMGCGRIEEAAFYARVDAVELWIQEIMHQ